jgi:hypothetical protein
MDYYRFISKFLVFNNLLWGFLRKNVIFKSFYRFKYVFMGFFDKNNGIFMDY